MHHLNSLEDLLVHELRDLYSAEQQLVVALPKMASAAYSTELRDAFDEHLTQTRQHISRLETIFTDLGVSKLGEECQAMKGLVKEGEEIIKSLGNRDVRDAALIAAAQRMEHYEMAGYGCARTYARKLGHDRAADLLQETLDEEGNADHNLTKLAEGSFFTTGINEKATA